MKAPLGSAQGSWDLCGFGYCKGPLPTGTARKAEVSVLVHRGGEVLRKVQKSVSLK